MLKPRARARRRQGRIGGWQARGRAPGGGGRRQREQAAAARDQIGAHVCGRRLAVHSRSGTSSSEEDDFDAESEAASEAVSDEVSSPGSSPGGAANASVYEGDEGETLTLEDLIADNY